MPDDISLQMARRQLAALTDPAQYDQNDPLVVAAILALRLLLGDISAFLKTPCLVATTTNVALTGAQTIDAIVVPAGSRVLVRDQDADEENGIYVTAAGAWSRAEDFADWSGIPGAIITVERGTTYGDTVWLSTADDGGTLDTDPIAFQQQSGAGDVAAEAAARSGADSTLAGLISSEATARANADTSEATTRGNADTALAGLITDETTRAEGAEAALAALIAGAGAGNSHFARCQQDTGVAPPTIPDNSNPAQVLLATYKPTSDVGGNFNLDGNGDVLNYEIPETGDYEIEGGAVTDSHTNVGAVQIRLNVEANTSFAGMLDRDQQPAGYAGPMRVSGKDTYHFTLGDLVRLSATVYNVSETGMTFSSVSAGFNSLCRWSIRKIPATT